MILIGAKMTQNYNNINKRRRDFDDGKVFGDETPFIPELCRLYDVFSDGPELKDWNSSHRFMRILDPQDPLEEELIGSLDYPSKEPTEEELYHIAYIEDFSVDISHLIDGDGEFLIHEDDDDDRVEMNNKIMKGYLSVQDGIFHVYSPSPMRIKFVKVRPTNVKGVRSNAYFTN